MGYINPLLRLPAARHLLALPELQRRAMAKVLRGMRDQANTEAELAWKRRKAAMAAYWRAVSTYARHFAHALDTAKLSSDAPEASPPANHKLDQVEFDQWWRDHGQYLRAGGGQYEITFAYEAARHFFAAGRASRA